MITEIRLTDLQQFVINEVKNSTEFATLVDDLLGDVEFGFYRGGDLMGEAEPTPYFTSYKFNSANHEGKDPSWTLQFCIGIDPDENSTLVDGVYVWESTDKVEQLATKALSIVKQSLLDGLFGGSCLLRVSSENILITEIGEAQDVQAIVTFVIESYSTF
ncbi:hypothetical protein TPMD03_62 [Thiohalocapsa phage LS06-2018-MD03]|nr:hypothetical protein TPMD03_62 [Thiohalocapsa phage LS06-2018-MD03]